MTVSLESIRSIMSRLMPNRQRNGHSRAGKAIEGEEPRRELVSNEVASAPMSGDGSRVSGTRTSDLTGLMSAYLNARAEEIVALLLDGLTNETTRELGQMIENSRQSISAEVAAMREGVTSSQREVSRMGRELVRTGATMESVREALSSMGADVGRLETALQTELDIVRQLRVETGLAGLDEILATLDGLEIGLTEGRDLLQAMAVAHRRLKDSTVQRWWRAMGEATGIKRPLPEVPLADFESLIAGLELTYRRLQDSLARRGVTAIEAAGKPFDPYVHEAVATEPCPEEQERLVLREERRGYRTGDRVIRLSQVVVGRGQPVRKATKGRLSPSDRRSQVDQAQTTDGPAELDEKGLMNG